MDGRLKQHDVRTEIRNYVREVRARSSEEHTLVNVIIPETVRHLGWRHLLHTFHIQRLKATLVGEADVVVTNVTHHAGYEQLEPVGQPVKRQLLAEWHHVAVVMVAGVHNATARSVRYALSLGADELRCVHVNVDDKEAKATTLDWDEWDIRVPLEILDSPYRQIARPIHSYVRRDPRRTTKYLRDTRPSRVRRSEVVAPVHA